MVSSCNATAELAPRKERVMKLLRVYADDMTEVDEVPAGNIAAIVGLKATRTGDTLNGPPVDKGKKAAKGASATAYGCSPGGYFLLQL